jgi:hypothetical protein
MVVPDSGPFAFARVHRLLQLSSTDTRLDFEPVVEDHDLAYIFNCSQSRILERLDALVPGPASKQIKTFFCEEIARLLSCRGSHDQIPTPLSNASTSLPMQSQSRDSDIAIVEKEGGLPANAPVPSPMTEGPNTEGQAPPVQSRTQDGFEVCDAAEPSSTVPIRQPLTRYDAPIVPGNQTFDDLLAESTQSFGEISQRPSNLTLSNSELDMIQSSTQSQPTFCYGGIIPLHRNSFPQTSQDSPLIPNNGFSPMENDFTANWPDILIFNGNHNYDYTGSWIKLAKQQGHAAKSCATDELSDALMSYLLRSYRAVCRMITCPLLSTFI